MSSEFKGNDNQKGQVFGITRNSESSHRSSRTLILGVSATVCIVASVLVAERVLRKGPYDEMVGQLHPRMTSNEVVQALGSPYSKEDDIGEGTPGRDNWWLYKADGTDLPLIIQFDGLSLTTLNSGAGMSVTHVTAGSFMPSKT